jgi:hypothetical protein
MAVSTLGHETRYPFEEKLMPCSTKYCGAIGGSVGFNLAGFALVRSVFHLSGDKRLKTATSDVRSE